MDIGAYHVLELQIASDPADTRRVMPAIGAHHRRILDVGCGAGQTLIASRLGRDVTAIGIDRDETALALGRRIDPRVRLVRASGESLPLPTGFFDLAISRVALPYMRNREALAEMARVLRPGGELWLALHPFSLAWGEFRACVAQRQWRAALLRLYGLANGAFSHLTGREFAAPFSGRCHSFQTRARIVRTLESLGFEDIRVDQRSFFVVSATKGRAP